MTFHSARTVSIVLVASMFVRVACDNTGRIQWLIANSNITNSSAYNHQGGMSNDCAQSTSYKSTGLRLIQTCGWRRLVFVFSPPRWIRWLSWRLLNCNCFFFFLFLQKLYWWTLIVRKRRDWLLVANHVCWPTNGSMRKSHGPPQQQHFNRFHLPWILFNSSLSMFARIDKILFCCFWATQTKEEKKVAPNQFQAVGEFTLIEATWYEYCSFVQVSS